MRIHCAGQRVCSDGHRGNGLSPAEPSSFFYPHRSCSRHDGRLTSRLALRNRRGPRARVFQTEALTRCPACQTCRPLRFHWLCRLARLNGFLDCCQLGLSTGDHCLWTKGLAEKTPFNPLFFATKTFKFQDHGALSGIFWVRHTACKPHGRW